MDLNDKKNYNNVRSFFHIKEVVFDEKTRQKLLYKHGVEPWQVKELAINASELFWEESKEHGMRFIATAETEQGQEIYIALQLLDARKGRWKCITAFYEER